MNHPHLMRAMRRMRMIFVFTRKERPHLTTYLCYHTTVLIICALLTC